MLHRSLCAALVAAATLLMTPGAARADDGQLDRPAAKAAVTSGARLAATSRRAARLAARSTPLQVTIETLTPSAIPTKGKVRLAGTVTNTDTVPWLTVNVYSFISEEPMTTRAQLAAAVKVDETQSVGTRIVDAGNYDTIDEIPPGESRQFSFTVDVDLLEADSPGVYWFGVHALGQRSGEGRDELFLADGRARTFLPLVPAGREGRERVSVVVPLRRDISYADDGSLTDLHEWVTTLGDAGRLRSLVELASTAGDRTVNWVVDPALVDAVRQLAAGNPPRSLAANLEEGQQDDQPSDDASASGSPSEDATPSEEPTEEPTDGETGADPTSAELPEDLDPETLEAAEAAREWLGRLRSAMDASDEVFTLPYGDMDVSAAARLGRGKLLDQARERAAEGLAGVDVATSAAIAPPSGYLSAGGIRAATDDETVIVGDRLFPDPPSVATVAGRRVVVTSSGAADGGPAPGDPRGTIAMRQRILAEAAVRFLKPARSPLVVLLPYDWVPPASTSFFSGLDLDWIDLSSVQDANAGIAGEDVSTVDLKYPERQTDFELDAANFDAATALQRAGSSLDSMLTLNDVVGDTVAAQALTSTSYGARARPDSTRAATDRSRAWIEDQLAQVEVTVPQAVTLSSINGSFPTSIRNRLDETVTVSLAADSGDQKLTIDAPPEVEIPANGSANILLDARTDTPGVHDVTIRVTDTEGNALGGSDELSIRSARVSNIIWLFLATGIGLLFGTIGFRLVRRVRAARR